MSDIRTVVSAAGNAIICLDKEHRITEWNCAAEQLYGFRREEVLGKDYLAMFIPEDHIDNIATDIKEVLGGKTTEGYVNPVRRRDGTERLVSWTVTRMLSSRGTAVGVIAVGTDVTERKQADEKLQRKEAELAHVSRLSTLGEMVAGIAHEINQPLYAIANFATACKAILDSDDHPQGHLLQDFNHKIAEQAVRAGDIIRRLRYFVKKSDDSPSSFNINVLVEESVELLAPKARLHRVLVRIELADSPIHVVTDQVQIQQAIVNLLRNAIESMLKRDSSERVATVRTSLAESEVLVSVEDNGEGIPNCPVDKLFDAFFTTKKTGMGMGLAITRTIIEAHGGRINVIRGPEAGTTFQFTLPLELIA